MKDLLIVIALGLACGGALVFIVVWLFRLRREIGWYRVSRDIDRDAKQRAKFESIMRAGDGHR